MGRVPGENETTDAEIASAQDQQNHSTAPELQDEPTLVDRARSDGAAFGELYQRYARSIYNYVYYRTGNHHEAEDLTARTFQQALSHMHSYQDRGLPFSAWLYRIAHNLVANWHRDQSRRAVISIDELGATGAQTEPLRDGMQPLEALAEDREQRERLLSAIRRLPPDRQQLLILKFVERLSNAEVAAILGRTEGAVKSLYHRTLLALRDELVRHP
jgi:RNA polymerase sigma-70 factor (ECF subfamily)